MIIRLAALLLLTLPCVTFAESIRIAVASNFAPTLQVLADSWQSKSGHKVTLSPGSTGKHYAQIVNGAPFDAFFAADLVRPERLEQSGHALPGSRFTYAHGRLVLWSMETDRIDEQGRVSGNDELLIAIANPELAPYGRAAQEVMTNSPSLKQLTPKLIRGQNVSQALQFVASGNADMGFIPLSLAQGLEGSMWRVPTHLHSPIVQQAVQLADHRAVNDFLDFVRSETGRSLIRSAGYEVPK